MELDDMGGVNEPVADRVGERGLTDHVVPGLDGELTGDEGRRAFGAILEDLEQIVALGRGERRQAPVVDHEQLGLGQPGEQARVGAVAARDVEVVKQARGPGAVGRVAGAAGALGEGFGEPRLADPGGPEEEEVAMLGDPGARRQGMKLGLIEAPPRAVPVDVFERRLAAQVGGPQSPSEFALLAMRPLGIDEQAEAILEAELGLLASRAATSAAVAGPVVSAQLMRREGVHSACARWACGMWADSVAYWPRPQCRRCEATRRPLRNSSTVVAPRRTSTRWCTSW